MDKCYIYLRVSTEAQVDGYSLDAQEKRLEEYAEYKELEISGRYCDAGRSGKDIKGRPELQRMLDDITSQKDEITCVLVFKLSRFGRNAADVLRSMQILSEVTAIFAGRPAGILLEKITEVMRVIITDLGCNL